MFLESERSDAQGAFIALLANPVATPWESPESYVLVRRHLAQLRVWASRLGYAIVGVDRTFRLRRIPVGGAVAAPASDAPTRAQLVMTLYVAVCLEDHRDDSISLQEISDRLAQFAGLGNRWPYDPNARSQRRTLVDVVTTLVRHGVLERRTRLAMEEDWERSGVGIGGGYLLQRSALMLLVDTADVDLALARRAAADDTRRFRLLRALVETQALYPGELEEPDRAYLTGQRHRLVREAEEMTGGTVEVRADAWTLILPSDRELPGECLIGFPDTTALDWACLAVIDALGPGGRGEIPVARERVVAIVGDLHASRGDQLTAALRESPGVLEAAVARRLQSVGLARVDEAGWRVSPLAGRFRDAQLRLARTAEPDLFEEH